MVTTIHGFTSKKVLPVFQEYNQDNYYVSISDADRDPSLNYLATVYNGINLDEFEFNPKPKDYLVFLGRIARDKGTNLAIKVAKETGRVLKIAAIIPPEEKKFWEKEIKPLIDGKQIQYLGPADPKMRNEILREAFCSLHLIRFNEPFGLTLVEAMACGTPVIAMNKGSVPEIVIDGQSGYKVASVAEAAEKVEQIKRIKREDCREQVKEKFTREKMAENYEKVYQEILNQHEN
jgi:glycosyltransferase involved in cell wall biosynthesis